MNLTGTPIIITLCYIIGEIYKKIFNKNKKIYKYIPLLMITLGGIMGLLLYLIDPIMIFDSKNFLIGEKIPFEAS